MTCADPQSHTIPTRYLWTRAVVWLRRFDFPCYPRQHQHRELDIDPILDRPRRQHDSPRQRQATPLMYSTFQPFSYLLFFSAILHPRLLDWSFCHVLNEHCTARHLSHVVVGIPLYLHFGNFFHAHHIPRMS